MIDDLKRRRAEIQAALFERMAAKLIDRDLTDAAFDIALAEVAAEMETEIRTHYATLTADRMRELGVKLQ